jgi:hypothetical protein
MTQMPVLWSAALPWRRRPNIRQNLIAIWLGKGLSP